MDTLSRSRSHRRLYSGGINNTALQMRGSGGLAGRAGHGGSSHSQTTSITEELHPALIHDYRKAGQNLTDAAAHAEWANKRWVWVTDSTLGYVAGWIISEADDMIQVACVDDKVGIVLLMHLYTLLTVRTPIATLLMDIHLVAVMHPNLAGNTHRHALYQPMTSPR